MSNGGERPIDAYGNIFERVEDGETWFWCMYNKLFAIYEYDQQMYMKNVLSSIR